MTQHAPDQPDEQQEDDQAADEPELLEQNGEGEVGRLNGQQVRRAAPSVRPLPKMPPEPTAICACATWKPAPCGIGSGIEEREERSCW